MERNKSESEDKHHIVFCFDTASVLEFDTCPFWGQDSR